MEADHSDSLEDEMDTSEVKYSCLLQHLSDNFNLVFEKLVIASSQRSRQVIEHLCQTLLNTVLSHSSLVYSLKNINCQRSKSFFIEKLNHIFVKVVISMLHDNKSIDSQIYYFQE